MTVSDQIISILSSAAGAQTTKAIWQALRQRGFTLREDQVGAELQQMMMVGLVQRQGTGWRGLKGATHITTQKAAVTPSRSPTESSPLRLMETNRPPSTAAVTAITQAPKALTGRWVTFRRLCAYYVGCLLQDDAPSLRGYIDRHNDTWIGIRQSVPWDRLARTDYGFTVALAGNARSFQRNRARQGEDLSVFLGYPVQVVRPNGKDPWIVPIFVQPMSADWARDAIALMPDGPITVNSAWLESAFRTNPERLAFTNMVGLTVAVDEDDEEQDEQPQPSMPPSPGFSGLAEGLASYLHDRVAGTIVPGAMDLSDQWLDAPPSILNRAVVMLGPRVPYTRTLIRELRKLARWSDEDLDGTSLSAFFPHDPPEAQKPSPTNADSTTGLSADDVIQHKVLNDSQRKAVINAMHEPASLITGPPGTGKSEVVRGILLNQAARGRPALFASKNHRALDAVVPGLNALVGSGPLVIRASAQDLALRHSWKSTLRELLSRPQPDSDEDSTQLILDLAQSMSQVKQVLDEWSKRFCDEDAYAACQDRFEEHRRELPQVLRSEDQIGTWPLNMLVTTLAQWRTEHEMLTTRGPSFFLRVWRWLHQRRRRQELLEMHARMAGLPDPAIAYSDIESDGACQSCDQRFAVWKHWAAAADTLRSRRQMEEQLRSMRSASELSNDLQAAVARSSSLGVKLMDRIAGGRGFSLTPAMREDLNNLRAGIANMGERRWTRQFREHFPVILRAFPLWAVSNLSVGSSLPLTPGTFDLAVIDEASQCDIASAIPILARARRAVIVGDPRQLTHVTRLSPSAERQQLEAHALTNIDVQRFSYRENSCFDLANGNGRIEGRSLLRQHFRCHPQIAEYANTTFYQGTLDVVTATDRLRVPAGVRPGLHWTHIASDIEPAATGVICRQEIAHIIDLLRNLQTQGYSGTVGVVTPFKHQMIRLRDAIEQQISREFIERSRLLVSTAHGFQGDERDLLLLSLCCGPSMPDGALRFVANGPNLFNVAVTRARAVLHVVGNREWALTSDVFFLKACAELSLNNSHDEQIASQPFESPWERVLGVALEAVGVHVIPQYRIAGRRLDLAVVNPIKLDIEVDGEAYHRTASGGRKDDDCWRDLQLQSLGWLVRRFWVYELKEDLPRCVEIVRSLLVNPP